MAAGVAALQMAASVLARACPAVVRGRQDGAHVIAVRAAGLLGLDEVVARSHHQLAGGDRGDAELGRDRLVRRALELARQQRDALVLGEAGDVDHQHVQLLPPHHPRERIGADGMMVVLGQFDVAVVDAADVSMQRLRVIRYSHGRRVISRSSASSAR